MKHFALVLLLSLTGTLAFAADLKPYDGAAMREIMRSNGGLVGWVNKAVAAGDWTGVATAFGQFAQNAEKALQYAPPKGDAKEWTKLWEDFRSAAWRGVGSAGEKDAAKAKAALGNLTADRNAGHGQFN